MEVSILSRLHHPGIVKLLGVCVDGDQRIAVFELLSRGSLSSALSLEKDSSCGRASIRQPERQHLTWQQRVQIALGLAHGLAHMHQVCSWQHPEYVKHCTSLQRSHSGLIRSARTSLSRSLLPLKIIMLIVISSSDNADYLSAWGAACLAQERLVHRDVTSGNVLLTEGAHARIADLGLAQRLVTPDSIIIAAPVEADSVLMGTYGYVAPEYAMSGEGQLSWGSSSP